MLRVPPLVILVLQEDSALRNTSMFLWSGRMSDDVFYDLHVLSCSDFGYYRAENSSECVEQEELKGRPLEFCLNGTTEQLQTSGLGSMFLSFYLPQLQL